MFELSIDLKTDGKQHLYEQIYEFIRDEIRKGKLLCGEKLPSTRSLAEYLSISRSTIELAYAQLVSEGYLEVIPCKGYFVSHIENLLELEPGRIQEPVQEEEKSRVLYDFSPHAIDMQDFPFATWRKITKNTLGDERRDLFHMGDPRGDLALRKVIQKYLYASRGVNCDESQIVVGAGNDYLLMLLYYILGPNRRVAMENPTYMRAYKIFKALEYKVTPVTMDQNGIRIQPLKDSDADVVYVMPSHQYPTGIVMPIGRRTELLRWAKEKPERYIIEDDYDSEFRYRGKPIPALQSSDQSGRVIYIGTFSKSIAPAIRISFMVLPLTLLKKYKEQCSFLASTVSRLDQSNLEMFIKEGYFERYLNKMRKRYRNKHDMFMELLEPFHQDFIVSGEEAGMHIILEDKRGRSERELIELAAKQQIKVYGMEHAWISMKEEKPLQRILLGYGGLKEADMPGAVRALAQAWSVTLR